MSASNNGTLRVPGADLYYEVRGSGPVLLILQGGDGDAGGCHDLVNRLVDHYTVVTYDRRGLSRSKLDDPLQAIRLETHCDDAHRLLAALTTEPAMVFGGSLGALLGLDLVARYPNQVHTLVAHEPPAPELLPDAERAQAVKSQEEMEETFQREGVAGSMRKMASSILMDLTDRETDVQLAPPTPQRAANFTFFLAHDAPAVRRYRLDIAALKAAQTRIVPAAGMTSRDAWTHHCARALADRLGTEFAEFPGGHNGYIFHPRAIAAKLQDVLEASGT